MNAMFILPFDGSIQFPGLPEDAQVGFCILSYAPAAYVLAEITTTQAHITTLTAQADCLFLCNVIIDEDGKSFETTPLVPQERVAIVNKVKAMGLPALVNAAIQASQNRSDLVYAIAYKAMTRNVQGDLMIEEDVKGQGLG